MHSITHNDQSQINLQNSQNAQNPQMKLSLKLRQLQPAQERPAVDSQPLPTSPSPSPQAYYIPQTHSIPQTQSTTHGMRLDSPVGLAQQIAILQALSATHPTMPQVQPLQVIPPVSVHRPTPPQLVPLNLQQLQSMLSNFIQQQQQQRQQQQIQFAQPIPQARQPESTPKQTQVAQSIPQTVQPESAQQQQQQPKTIDKPHNIPKYAITTISGAIKAIKSRRFINPLARTKTKRKIKGIMPRVYTCAICGLTSKRRTNLRAHELTHDPSSEKKHSCSHCDYKSHRKHDVQRHEANHHGGDPSKLRNPKSTRKRQKTQKGIQKRI